MATAGAELRSGGSSERHGSSSRRARLARAAQHLLFGLVPVVATLFLVAYQFKIHAVALDFHVAYYPAARRLLDGLSPYALSRSAVAHGYGFVYPALSAVLMVPLALIGRSAAQAIYMLACIACVPATLLTLRVRDWRIYGLVLLWLPVFVGWQGGNVTLPLMLIAALTWRHRASPAVAGLLVALAISVKPFVWPLWIWLVATRRFRAAGLALAWGVAVNLVAWALVGYGQIGRFLELSGQDASALWRQGYGVPAVAHHLGLGRVAGGALLLGLALALLVAVLARGFGRGSNDRHADRDSRALTLAVALMLVASPLVWVHYFALLLVPLAVRRPRLGPVWALPLLMWPLPPRQPVHGWEEALAWAIAAVCLAGSLRPVVGRRSDAPGRGAAAHAPAGQVPAAHAAAGAVPGGC